MAEQRSRTGSISRAVERMAEAGAKDSLPTNGMFNSYQLDAMKAERLPTYRRIAEVMLEALLTDDQEVAK